MYTSMDTHAHIHHTYTCTHTHMRTHTHTHMHSHAHTHTHTHTYHSEDHLPRVFTDPFHLWNVQPVSQTQLQMSVGCKKENECSLLLNSFNQEANDVQGIVPPALPEAVLCFNYTCFRNVQNWQITAQNSMSVQSFVLFFHQCCLSRVKNVVYRHTFHMSFPLTFVTGRGKCEKALTS